MEKQGWIRMWRSIEDWEWYKVPFMVHFFQHLILKANHKEKKWQGITIKRGQFVTSLNTLHQNTGISTQSIRTCLKRLKSTGEITIGTTQVFSLITVCNYEAYQGKDIITNTLINTTANNQSTINQQSINTQPTLTKNDKNVKNEKNGRSITPTLKMCIDIGCTLGIPEQQSTIWYEHYSAQGFYFSSNVAMTDLRMAMNRHKNNGTLAALVEKASKIKTPEQETKLKELGRKNKEQRIRDSYQNYLENKTTSALKDLRKDKGHISICHWLIDEILAKRDENRSKNRR